MNETAKNAKNAKKLKRIFSFLGVLSVLCGSLQLNLPIAVAQQVVHTESQRLLGVGSCTSVGCHGGTRPGSIVGSEYSIWVAQDPHARAYSALFDARSLRMIRQLDGLPTNAVVAPQNDFRCLVCHSMKHAAPAVENFDVLTEGVGCESCHGPASEWVADHYQSPLSPQARGQMGMWNTDRLLTRTQICVECHVGGPGREVNHDLIAAGHPRLQFEMGAYFAALPKHWIDAEDREGRKDDFDAQLWALGQVSTSQAALKQLARRAEPGHIWPEFSEWACSACHHELRDNPSSLARQQLLSEQDRLSGRVIDWDTWNHFMTRGRTASLSQAFGIRSGTAATIDRHVTSLEALMQQLNPNRKQVAELADNTAKALASLAVEIERADAQPPNLQPLIGSVLTSASAANDWSTAAQTYNALATLQEMRLRNRTVGNDDLSDKIQQLYKKLAATQKDPRDPSSAFDAKQVANDFKSAKDQLSKDGSR
jgi:hypothetical protein